MHRMRSRLTPSALRTKSVVPKNSRLERPITYALKCNNEKQGKGEEDGRSMTAMATETILFCSSGCIRVVLSAILVEAGVFVRSLLIVVGKEGHLFSGLQQALHVLRLMDNVGWGSEDKFASLIYA